MQCTESIVFKNVIHFMHLKHEGQLCCVSQTCDLRPNQNFGALRSIVCCRAALFPSSN